MVERTGPEQMGYKQPGCLKPWLLEISCQRLEGRNQLSGITGFRTQARGFGRRDLEMHGEGERSRLESCFIS